MKFLSGRGLNYLPVLSTPYILLAPIYLSGRALFWGTPLLQFMPWWNYAWGELLAGHLPLWNPMIGMGAPLLANYQCALFYPPTWIYLVLYLIGGIKLMAWGQALMVASHLAWAGLGMTLLARRLGLRTLAQVMTGLAFSLSSFFVARSWFLSINAAISWLPWILVCITPDINRGENSILSRRRSWMLVVCAALQLLAGHAQIAWYTLLLAFLWTIFWSWQLTLVSALNLNLLHRLSKIAIDSTRPILAISLAFGLTAIQLLPTAEYLLQSQRSTAVDYQQAVTYSFWPWRLLTFFAPTLFGSPASGNYRGYANYWEDAGYIGLLPLLLAIGTLFTCIISKDSNYRIYSISDRDRSDVVDILKRVRFRRLVWLLVVILIIALVLALGKNTPIFPWLYFHVPTFSMFQAPTRWMVWGVFSLSLLSGIGAESWCKPRGWGLYWTRLGIMAAFAVSLGSACAFYMVKDIRPSFIWASSTTGLLGLGAGILSLMAPVRESRIEGIEQSVRKEKWINTLSKGIPSGSWKSRLFQFKPPSEIHSTKENYPLYIWQWAVVIFVATDLVAMNWGLIPAGDLRIYSPSPTAGQVRLLANGGRLFIPADIEYWIKYDKFLRFDTFYPGEDWENLRATLLANSNMLDGLHEVNNFDPLIPARFSDWMEMLTNANPDIRREMLQMMNVTVVESLSNHHTYGIQFERENGKWYRWISCSRVMGTSIEGRKLIMDGGVDFDREVLLEGVIDIPGIDCRSQAYARNSSASHSLQISDSGNPNRIELRVNAELPAWLVLSDVWYPGWQAWLDGQLIPILRANYLFRAIWIPTGDHRLILTYQPLSFLMGLVITCLSFIVFVFLVRRRIAQ